MKLKESCLLSHSQVDRVPGIMEHFQTSPFVGIKGPRQRDHLP